MIIHLNRFAYTPMGTFGQIVLPEYKCWTVELPWVENMPRVSCIPEGEYPYVFSRFNRGGYDCIELLNIPDRSLIKVHIGNTTDDLLGCISPGRRLGTIKGSWAVLESRVAFDGLMKTLGRETGTIRIGFTRSIATIGG